MSLLDNLLGGMMGGAQQGQSPLLQAALQLIQQNGGLPGIISKFEHGGMADHVILISAEEIIHIGRGLEGFTNRKCLAMIGDSTG